MNPDDPNAQPGSTQLHEHLGTHIDALYRYFNNHPRLKVFDTSYKETYQMAELTKTTNSIPPCDVDNLYPRFSSVLDFAPYVQAELRKNRVILVEWTRWDGHWSIIIGYDDGGTPSFTGDDQLITADPFDTLDHQQDGYSVVPMQGFFFLWHDRSIAPKPYQLQPFLAIGER